jgi:CHAT domain-containing protein
MHSTSATSNSALHVGAAARSSESIQDSAPAVTTISRPGERLARAIKGSEVQTFRISLTANQYAQINFAWQGIDLEVNVFKPDGQPLLEATVPVRFWGTLPVIIIAGSSESYTLEVRLTEKLNLTGGYSLTLEDIRPATETDRSRFAAEKRIASAASQKVDDTAIGKLQEALNLYLASTDLPGAAVTAQKLTRRCVSTKKPEDAKAYYQQTLELLKKLKDWRGFAYTLSDFATDEVDSRSPQETFNQALTIFQELSDQRGEAQVLYGLGYYEARHNDVSKGLQWLARALPKYQAENDRLGEGNTLNAMGGSYNLLADQEQALSYYQQAILIWQELNHKYFQAITNQNIGVIYDDWGDWETARASYTSTLAIYKSLLSDKYPDACQVQSLTTNKSFCRSIANTLDNLGELNNSVGESQKAQELFQESLLIRQTVNEPQGMGATLSRIAYSYVLQFKPNEAIQYCDRALSYSADPKVNDKRKQASSLTWRGMAYAQLNQPEKALAEYRKALELQEVTGVRRGQGITLDQMGRAYTNLGRYKEAFDSYDSALAIWVKIKDEDWETRTRYNFANAARASGDLIRASEQITTALQIVESRRASLKSLQLRTAYFANKEDMYALDIDVKMLLGKNPDSSRQIIAALESSENARARTLLDILKEVEIDRGDQFPSKADPLLRDLIERKRLLQNQLNNKARAQTSMLAGKPRPERIVEMSREIDALTNDYDEVLAQIRSKDARYAGLIKPQPLSLSELQQDLGVDSVLVEYALGEERSYAWVVSQNSIKAVDLEARNKIETLARRMAEALTERNRRVKNESPQQVELHRARADAQASETAVELSKIVIQPMAELLGKKRLIIVADGALQLIPFQLLSTLSSLNLANGKKAGSKILEKAPAMNDRRMLIGDHEIVYLASASVLAVQRKEMANRKPAPHALAIFADPVFDQEGLDRELTLRHVAKVGQTQPGGNSGQSSQIPSANTRSGLTRAVDDMGIGSISSLPQSREEAEAIMNVVPMGEGMAALGLEASRARVMNPDLSQYRIIHFATHGFADFDHPELSGIVLSLVDEHGKQQDGYLRLHDIYNLDLPADLVVLSACQTGVGKQIKGEGLIALTRGFTYAGAARVVASLWKVDDEATKHLMEEFYKQMFTNKRTPAAALREAQMKLSRQSQWRSPFYWAGFVLQGEWR